MDPLTLQQQLEYLQAEHNMLTTLLRKPARPGDHSDSDRYFNLNRLEQEIIEKQQQLIDSLQGSETLSAGASCSRKATLKYTSRPSPPFPANECCGQRMRGNDGGLYVSSADRNGRCAWKKVSASPKRKASASPKRKASASPKRKASSKRRASASPKRRASASPKRRASASLKRRA